MCGMECIVQDCLRGKGLGPAISGFFGPARRAEEGATSRKAAGLMNRGQGARGWWPEDARRAEECAWEEEFATKATKFHGSTFVLFTRLPAVVLQLPATPQIQLGRVKCL